MEVAETTGTPHFQGAVIFKAKQRFTAVTKLLDEVKTGVHWGKMRKSWARNVIYCTKDIEKHGDWSRVFGNCPEANRWKPWEQAVMDDEYANVKWWPWQEECLKIARAPADPRKVHWFWEPTGKSGKSYLMKWMFLNFRCILGGGKKADVFYQVQKHFEVHSLAPQLVLLDIPRASQKFCSYGVMEDLKNGMVSASKYEGGRYAFKSPVLIVFSNELPAFEMMSEDRWDIHRIVLEKRTAADVLMGGNSANLIV